MNMLGTWHENAGFGHENCRFDNYFLVLSSTVVLVEGTKRSVYLRESPKMVEEPRIEIVR